MLGWEELVSKEKYLPYSAKIVSVDATVFVTTVDVLMRHLGQERMSRFMAASSNKTSEWRKLLL